MIYAADPWAVIAGSVAQQVQTQPERDTAASFVRQAREYFTAAGRASTIETRPLLYYYSFLNLGKAISIAHGRPGLVGKVAHGIAAVNASGHSPSNAEVAITRSAANGNRPSAVDELHRALEDGPVSVGNYPVRDIIAQSVVAHRMWREAFANPRIERFMTIDQVRLFDDPDTKRIWSRIYVRRDVLKTRKRGVSETLRESSLDAEFRAVADGAPQTNGGFHVFEQVSPTVYSHRSSDVVMEVIDLLRKKVWQTILATKPYRGYYLYLSPPGELRMPQWLSIYSILFWLGSLTRYQPVELLDVLDGSYGPFFREFIETQPSQLLYILASELKKQDVTKASIV